MESYKEKYLKYKKKYMREKYQQQGGADPDVMEGNQKIPDPEFAINEIYFWGNQMKEHADVISISLELPEERNLALEQKQKWHRFMKKEFMDKGIKIELANYDEPNKVKIELTEQDFSKINIKEFDFPTLFTLLTELREFEESLINRLNKGEWMGWLYLSYVQHVLMELNSFERRIKGVIPVNEDLEFYVQMSKEHTAIAEKLTDKLPENFDLEKILRQSYDKSPLMLYSSKHEMEQIILASFKYVQEIGNASIDLQKKILNKEYKGLVRQDMIDHVVREQVKAEKMVLAIKNKKN
ncbi:hypothetical protein Catovirus_1_672 [Catovirus CTV1]|uniref:Uncharacterized protein n=1 Tax=Catovirus CTV1 TaxID=1977631 RepID=A0A1V0SA90_9VIRU|nr:hypothetical protein Catovirus_1_672 [Catovirus CTV1]